MKELGARGGAAHVTHKDHRYHSTCADRYLNIVISFKFTSYQDNIASRVEVVRSLGRPARLLGGDCTNTGR